MADSGLISAQAALNKTQYIKAFLEREKETLALAKFAQKRKVTAEKNKGDNVEFTQYLKKAPVTSYLTEATPGTDSDFVTQTKGFTLQEWGDHTKTSSRFNWATWDQGLSELSSVMGQQAAESLELDSVATYMKWGHVGMRADNDSNYEIHGLTVDTYTAATPSIACDELTEADDYWNGAIVTITEGPGYGEARYVTDFATSGDLLTLDSAFDATLTTASKFSICQSTGMVATDILTGAAVRRAVRQLRRNNAMLWRGKWAAGILSPNTEYDLMSDSTVQSLFINHPSGNEGIFENSVGKVWGVEFVRSTVPGTHAVGAATYTASAAVEIVPFLGMNSLASIEASGAGLKMIFTEPRIAEPRLHMYGFMGWKRMYVVGTLNAAWSVGMKVGVTA